jgi:hypothetical protein
MGCCGVGGGLAEMGGMIMRKWLLAGLGLMFSAALAGAPAQTPQTLRIGLAEDPDLLDPTLPETSGACPTGNFAPYDPFKVTRML